jgi:putative transposase
MASLTKSELKSLYRKEEDPRVKERLLFILRVEGDGAVPSNVAEEELHRSRPWASYWLRRYLKEGVDGLKDKERSGRPSELPAKIALAIKRDLLESDQGWTTEQAAEMIAERGVGVRYHFTHVYRLLHKWGLKQKVPKKVHINTASKEEKEEFKKG